MHAFELNLTVPPSPTVFMCVMLQTYLIKAKITQQSAWASPSPLENPFGFHFNTWQGHPTLQEKKKK